MIRYLSFLLICLWAVNLSAQTAESKAVKKVEIGLNITHTLAGFFNSGGQDVLLDPYIFSLKLLKNNGAIRTAYNFRVRTSSEFDFNTGVGGQRDAKETAVDIRVGWEWRKKASNRFSFYWGADLVSRFRKEVVDFNDFQSSLKLDEQKIGIGGGPIMGILFFITPTITLSTEAAIYGVYESGRIQNDLIPGSPAERVPTRGFELVPTIPNALYIHFRF